MSDLSPIRVCHISTMSAWGGVERLVVDLLTRPPASSLTYSLLTTSSHPDLLRPLQAAAIPIYEPRRSFRFDPRAIWQMARWLRREKIQVVHTYNAFANVWGGLAAALAGTPIVVAGEHGSSWWIRPPMQWLDQWAQRRAHLVVANSEASAQMLQLRYQLTEQQIRVVPNGVPPLPTADVAVLKAELGLSGKTIVGSIGRLDTPKQFSVFVAAAAKIATVYPDVCFVIVGGGPLATSLQAHIAAVGLGERFKLLGWRDDARQLVQIFDLFVSTSIRETFGLVLVEAALAAVPAIAPAVDGIPDVVRDGETGLLLTPTEPVPAAESLPKGTTPPAPQALIHGKPLPPLSVHPDQLAEAMRALLDNSSLRREMGSCAKKHAEAHFTMNQYQRALETLYMEVIGN